MRGGQLLGRFLPNILIWTLDRTNLSTITITIHTQLKCSLFYYPPPKRRSKCYAFRFLLYNLQWNILYICFMFATNLASKIGLRVRIVLFCITADVLICFPANWDEGRDIMFRWIPTNANCILLSRSYLRSLQIALVTPNCSKHFEIWRHVYCGFELRWKHHFLLSKEILSIWDNILKCIESM